MMSFLVPSVLSIVERVWSIKTLAAPGGMFKALAWILSSRFRDILSKGFDVIEIPPRGLRLRQEDIEYRDKNGKSFGYQRGTGVSRLECSRWSDDNER